jgi:hypothetical protein
MDEMLLIQELGRETPALTDDQLAPARQRLATAMAGQPADRVRAARPAHRRSAWRLAWAGFAVVGVAAAITGVVVLAPDKVGGRVPVANAEAAQVLHLAAAAALQVPDVEPRPEQFVYVKTLSAGQTREVWFSVDGTRDGFAIDPGLDTEPVPFPGCRNGRRVVVKGNRADPTRTEECVPEPAYLSDLPTDVDHMLEYLKANSSGEAGDPGAIGKDISDWIAESYVRPAALAALFEAAARLPGLTLVGDVTDGAGRHGTGIEWSRPQEVHAGTLVFDAHHAYLGSPLSAVLAVKIVDKVGSRG